MYIVLPLPKTEKEFKKLKSSSSTHAIFQQKMFSQIIARIDTIEKQLGYIFPQISFDYSLESLQEVDKAMNEYITNHSKEYQSQDIYSCWIDWIQLPDDIKSIAFDIGVYAIKVFGKFINISPSWNTGVEILSGFLTKNESLHITTWLSMAWSKFHDRDKNYLFDSINWQIRRFKILKEKLNPPYPIGSDKWIEYVIHESEVYGATCYRFSLEISGYEVLFVNLTITDNVYYALSPEGGLSTFFIYVKNGENSIKIIDDESLPLYHCWTGDKIFDRKKDELSECNRKLRDKILKKIFGDYRELSEIPMELKEHFIYSPSIFHQPHATYFRGFFVRNGEPDNSSEGHMGGLFMFKRGIFKKENGIQEDTLVVSGDRAGESCFGRLLGTTSEDIRLFGVYDFDTYDMLSKRGFSLDGVKYKRFSTLVRYDESYFEDTGRSIFGMRVYRARENAYEKYEDFFARYYLFYSDSFSFQDFLKRDIVLFVKTDIGLYIEIYNADLPRKADGKKSREVHKEQRQKVINEIVDRSKNGGFDIRDLGK